jgi:hypothetical protein
MAASKMRALAKCRIAAVPVFFLSCGRSFPEEMVAASAEFAALRPPRWRRRCRFPLPERAHFDQIGNDAVHRIDRDRESYASIGAGRRNAAVGTPINRPAESSSGPPALLGLTAASVWMTLPI